MTRIKVRLKGGQGLGGGTGEGLGGNCICPKCGYKTEHVIGKACNKTKCPKCGTMMDRES